MATYLALISISQKDYLGTKASLDTFVNIVDTGTLAQIATQVADYVALVGAIVGPQGLDVQVKIHLPVTGLPATPVAGSENEKTALFEFTQADSRYTSSVDVPGILESKIVDGKINVSGDADVSAFLTWFTSSHTPISVVSKYGNILQLFQSSALTFRKHRRSLNRTSSEVG